MHYFKQLLTKLPTTSKGFTLIELLIVISIIGILTTIASVNFIGVRERARDGQRKTDLSQIQTALEFYRSDESMYPPNDAINSSSLCNEAFTNGTSVYLKRFPCDPSTETNYIYNRVDEYNYTLTTCLENEEDKDRGVPLDGVTSCTEGEEVSYTVENP